MRARKRDILSARSRFSSGFISFSNSCAFVFMKRFNAASAEKKYFMIILYDPQKVFCDISVYKYKYKFCYLCALWFVHTEV